MSSMRRIAQLAGVSPMTVSLALRDSPKIRLETRQRIQAMATELHYVPLHSAETQPPTALIGYLIHEWFGDIATDILRGAMEEATRRQYGLMLMEAHQHEAWIEEALVALAKRQVAGVLLGHSYQQPLPRSILYYLRSRGIHVVQVMNRLFEDPVDAVCRSESRYADLLARRIRRDGHAAVYGVGLNRPDQWEDVLRTHDLVMTAHDSFSGAENLERTMAHFLALSPRPTVVVAGTDETAFHLCWLAQQHGLRIPEDLSVVGMGNLFGGYHYPRLATIDMQAREMGRIGANLLIDRIGAGVSPLDIREVTDIVPEPLLINRGSLGPAPRP